MPSVGCAGVKAERQFSPHFHTSLGAGGEPMNAKPFAPPLPVTLDSLAALPRWVAWQTEIRQEGKPPTKVPYSPGGAKAHADKPGTWGTRAVAAARAAKLPKPYGTGGVGIELGDMGDGRVLGGIDLDTCRDAAGTLAGWAQDVVDRLASYTETSPSGTGAKVFFLADTADVAALALSLSPKLARQFKRQGGDHPPAIEAYLGCRYFAVTDQRLAGTPAELRPVPLAALRWVLDVAGPALKGEVPKAAPEARQGVRQAGTAVPGLAALPAIQEGPGDPPGLLDRIQAKAATNRTLGKRWGGDWSKLRDESGSGRAFALAAALRKAGFDRADTLAGLRLHPDTWEWTATKGDAAGGRELARVWDHLEANHLPPPAAWLDKCQVNDKGEPIANVANALLGLRADPAIQDAFAYDQMQRAAFVASRLPGDEPGPDHTLRPVGDVDVTQVQEYLQLAGLPRLGKDTTHQALDKRAAECSFHPVQDYLTGLRWGGTLRVGTWLSYYLGAEHTEYTAGIGRMFLIAMVARILQPGCKADYMLVFEGPQGARKSTACAILAGPWFSDGLPDLQGDAVRVSQHLRGKWLIEVAEMSAMGKAESAELKAFITRREERFTPKYGRKEVIEPRQCVFAGTTNKRAFLRDETGGRRFWPVKVGSIDTDALQHDRDQLFAEAVHLFRQGEQWWPDADFERRHIAPEQEARYEADAWEDNIGRYLAGLPPGVPHPDHKDNPSPEPPKRVTVVQVAREALALDVAKLGTADQRRITTILERLGWQRGPRGSGGVRLWYPPAQTGATARPAAA